MQNFTKIPLDPGITIISGGSNRRSGYDYLYYYYIGSDLKARRYILGQNTTIMKSL